MRKIILILFLLVISCKSMQFTYDSDKQLNNILYNKTSVGFTGKDIPGLYESSTKLLGVATAKEYKLIIDIQEEKTRRSVKNNQAVSKVDYEILFVYNLYNILENCLIYNDSILSRFSYAPKSSGFNFSSDKSLDNLYVLTVNDNLKQFMYSLSLDSDFECENES